MDASNPVVKLCMDGMTAEGEGRRDDARRLFARAWATSTDDFERCVAAHYLARHQASPAETLHWKREALTRARMVGDDRVRDFYPSLYLNLGRSYEDFGQREQARRYYNLAAESVASLPADGYGAMVRRAINNGQRRTAANGERTLRSARSILLIGRDLSVALTPGFARKSSTQSRFCMRRDLVLAVGISYH